jgi:steroid delta-isomerase-like uncharacterized protein
VNHRQSHEQHRRDGQSTGVPSALRVISDYAAAMNAQDSKRMHALRSSAFVMDLVQNDAFQSDPLSAQRTQEFWPAWFAGFAEMDLEITRTIAAETVVVTQWVFTGTHTGPLEPPVFGRRVEPTGRTIRFRGVSIYDVGEGLIQRETMYIDLATIMVELGVQL